MIPAVEPKVLALPISISSSDNEHSDNLAYAPPQLVGKVKIAHSFGEANDSDTSSGKFNKVRFRTLGQKKNTPVADPPAIAASLIS